MRRKWIGIGAALASLALGACASSSRQAGQGTAPASAQATAQQDQDGAQAAGRAAGGQGDENPSGSAAAQNPASAAPAQPGAAGGPSAGSSDTMAGHQSSPAQPEAMPPRGSQSATDTIAGGQASATAPGQAGGEAGATAGAAGSTGTGSAGATGSTGAGAGPGTAAAEPAAPGEDAVTAQRHQLLFGSTERYDVSGKLAAVNTDRGEITIQRPTLPPALLKVDPQTKIQVDGRQGSLSELKPGGDVRASFNLSGRRPIAIQVDETSR